MEKRYECLGLQGITENESLKEFVADCFGYAVPGYGCNYLHRGFEDYIEFLYCMKGNESKPEPMAMDMHFSSNPHWTVWFDTALDTSSTAHKYLVRKSAGGKDLLPIRVLCPDVLARLQPGDEMYGQVVAYVKKGTIHKADPEESGTVYAVDSDAVSVSGKICDINSRNFSFENYECDFLELDVETEMGLITVLSKAEVLNAEPEIDDYLSAITYISMDVAVPSKRSRKLQSAFYEEKEYPNLPGDTEEINYENGFEPNSINAAKVLLAGVEKKDLFRFGRCCADYVQLHDGDDIQVLDRCDLVDMLADLLEGSTHAEEILNIMDAVYVYAYGKRKTTMLDGDYCAKLRDYNLSKGCTILVIYLHVTAEKNEDGETTFFVGMYGSKDKAPEVWELSWIGEQSSILFYPRKEMMDLGRRLMAAFNAQRLDILQTILSDNCSVEFLEGGRGLNGAVYPPSDR